MRDLFKTTGLYSVKRENFLYFFPLPQISSSLCRQVKERVCTVIFSYIEEQSDQSTVGGWCRPLFRKWLETKTSVKTGVDLVISPPPPQPYGPIVCELKIPADRSAAFYIYV